MHAASRGGSKESTVVDTVQVRAAEPNMCIGSVRIIHQNQWLVTEG